MGLHAPSLVLTDLAVLLERLWGCCPRPVTRICLIPQPWRPLGLEGAAFLTWA